MNNPGGCSGLPQGSIIVKRCCMKKLAVVLDVGSPVEKSLGVTTNFYPASEVLSPSGVDFSPWGDAVSAQTLGKLSGFGICRWQEGFGFCWVGLAVSEIAQILQHRASKLLLAQGTSCPGACLTEILQPPGSWELPFLSSPDHDQKLHYG